MYKSTERLDRHSFFPADGETPKGQIALTFAATACGIAGCLRTELHNAEVTAGLHQSGDIWLAYQSGQRLILATTSSVWGIGIIDEICAGFFLWCVFRRCRPERRFRRWFNFCALGLLSALVCAAIIYMPGADTPTTIDRTHGWITGGSIPDGYSLSFSQIQRVYTYPALRSSQTIIGALTVNGRVDFLTISNATQAQNIASMMQAFIHGQSVAIVP